MKKEKGLLRTSLLAAAIVCIIYGIGVISIIGVGHWFNFLGIIVGALLIILMKLLPLIRRLPVPVLILLMAALTACLFWFVSVEADVISYGRRPAEDGASYIIVLGAKVNGTTPSITLGRRIAVAADYMEKNPNTIAIATGGQGSDENISEGDVIAQRLADTYGIAADRILVEDKSTSTLENLKFSAEIIEENGGSMDDRIVIASSAFHIYRATMLAEQLGYTDISGTGSKSKLWLVPHYYVREFVAVFKEGLDGNL